MKKILFVKGELGAGGAEKSLVSLLNTMPHDECQIDLLLVNRGGLFAQQVPNHVRIIEPDNILRAAMTSIWDFKSYRGLPFLLCFKRFLRLFLAKRKVKKCGWALPQATWELWEKDIPIFHGEKYDAVVSYLEGITNYYVVTKVDAKRKFLYVHNEYEKLGYDSWFDENYFSMADGIVTISELCRQNLIKCFPRFAEKFFVLENITSSALILKMTKEPVYDLPFMNNTKDKFILSIGRLHTQKNYSLALKTAKYLRDSGLQFHWVIIGEGTLRKDLEDKIQELNLSDCVHLIGLRSNPYKYIAMCDVFVQSSLFEGKSIAIDEAKILCKPIVATNYQTVYDTLEDGVTGLIAEMNPKSLSDKIMQILTDNQLRDKIVNTLQSTNYDNTKEIYNYIQLFLCPQPFISPYIK